MNRTSVIIVGIAAVLITMLVWLFLRTFEYTTEFKDTGYSSEAMQNPYLAAEQFLKKFDVKVKGLSSMLALKKLPKTNEVLLIPTGRYDLSKKNLQEILDWVSRGGHLIVRARRIGSGEIGVGDDLLDKLGVQSRRKKEKGFVHHYYSGKVVTVKVGNKIGDKKVEFNANTWLKNIGKQKPSWQVDGKNGSQILEYKYGDGYVSVLSDLRFMDNAHIGQHDNAAFLYTLVHMNDNTAGMWIIRNDNMPSLIGVIASNAPAALYIFIATLLVWLWYITRRFGPLQRPIGNSRRSLREHISAAGHFQWRNRNTQALFQSARTALLEQVAQSRPPWSNLSQSSLSVKLSKLSGISADRILSVLKMHTVEKEGDFTQSIEIISSIRKNL